MREPSAEIATWIALIEEGRAVFGSYSHSTAQVIFKQGGIEMGDKGKKDKGKKEQQKKAEHDVKEKRKLKKEKKNK